MKIYYIPPLAKGDEGDFRNRCFNSFQKISPRPSLLKRGIFGSMTYLTPKQSFEEFFRLNNYKQA